MAGDIDPRKYRIPVLYSDGLADAHFNRATIDEYWIPVLDTCAASCAAGALGCTGLLVIVACSRRGAGAGVRWQGRVVGQLRVVGIQAVIRAAALPVERRVHGDGGASVAGEWIDIEDCAEKFNVAGGSCDTCSKPCPRSRSRTSAAKADGSYDVVIIGAGCIGAAVARELSKTTSSVLVLEAADDVTQGATKGNSGIVHAGFDDKPGSVRSKYCWAGNQMFAQLDRELHFGFQKNGSLVVAKGAEDEATLKELAARGEQNGVRNLKIIDQAQLRDMEPHIHPDATAALWSPDAGTVVPYEYAIALAENAADNGVEFRIRREVTAIEAQADGGYVVTARQWDTPEYIAHQNDGLKRIVAAATLLIAPAVAIAVAGVSTIEAPLAALPLLSAVPDAVKLPGVQVGLILVAACCCALLAYVTGASPKSLDPVGSGGEAITPAQMADGGSGSSSVLGGVTVATETIRCSYVVNCAGSASDKIASMVGDTSFKIKPRLGEYLLLNKEQGPKANATLFPAPGPLGKGVLVQGTLWGNLILGPTARDVHNPEHMAESTDDITGYIINKCKDLVPSFDPRDVIHSFAGARAKSDRNDWIIEVCKTSPKMIHAAGIDSPGLAGSPAIALDVVKLLEGAGLCLKPDRNFNPVRAPIIVPKKGWKGLKMGAPEKIAKANPESKVVCKCEKVTEAEVIEACRRGLPVDSTQTMRKRVRAGMGHCQADPANYGCEARVAQIIARETGIPLAAVGRRPWPATTLLKQRWLTTEQRQELASTAS